MLKNTQKFSREVTQKAGKYLADNFHALKRKDVNRKNRYEIVTSFDLGSEKIIISEIKKKFPNHSILSEEAGFIKGDKDHLWLIDPLDGTTNYRLGSPLFSVSLAYVYKNQIQYGIYHSPIMQETYEAELGKEAFLNGKEIHVSKIKKVSDSINLFCHSNTSEAIEKAIKYYSAVKPKSLDMRQLGAGSLELGFVASGRAESIAIAGANTWDVAAGVLLVREAGGRVTDFSGKEWNLQSKDMLATNGKILNELLKIIKRIK